MAIDWKKIKLHTKLKIHNRKDQTVRMFLVYDEVTDEVYYWTGNLHGRAGMGLKIQPSNKLYLAGG